METIAPRFEWAMTFLAIAESGSFTKAADHLNCSKAYVSKQITSLEKALGAKLLHRTTRRMWPTETGLIYLDYCRRLRETLNEAERTVSNLRSEISGSIRMSVPTTFGVEFMCDLVTTLHDKHPAIELDLDLSTEQRDLVAGGYDLALRLSRTLDPHLIAKLIGVVEDWVVASPVLADRLGPMESPAALSDVPCLCNSHIESDTMWSFMQNNESHVVQVRHWLRMNNYPLMRRAALAGLGVAKLPTYLVKRDVDEGLLVRLLCNYNLPNKPVFLVFPDQRPLPKKVRVMIDHVSAWFASGHPQSYDLPDRASA